MATKCIMCGKEINGSEVENTLVINTIRKIKRKFGASANNKLVVCSEHMQDYKKKRKSYEHTVIFSALACAVLLLFAFLIPLFSGIFNPSSIFGVLFLCILIVALSFLTYTPSLKKESHTPDKKVMGETDNSKAHLHKQSVNENKTKHKTSKKAKNSSVRRKKHAIHKHHQKKSKR